MKAPEETRDDVPLVARSVFDAVVSVTDEYCAKCLTDEYRVLVRRLVVKLARKRPSPLFRGHATTWGCGAVYAVGLVNFLFDSHQRPHVRAQDLCATFGVGATTGSAKAREIMKMFRIVPLDPRWCTSQKLVDNPLAQLREVLTLMQNAKVRRDESAEQRGAERAFWGRGTA